MGRPRKDAGGKAAKDRLLEAAFSLIRGKGYTATTVDELCEAAGVTKGTFFHYFASKEDLAVQAAGHWSSVTGEFFRTAPFHGLSDPLERFMGYIELRREILQGEISDFTCLVGTMVQEAYDTHPEIRKACYDSIFGHAETLEADIEAAIRIHAPESKVDAKSLALHTQAVLQGAFILAKASSDPEVASASIDHLLHYIEFLFARKKTEL